MTQSATIIIFPTVPVLRETEGHTFQVSLPRLAWGRLVRGAAEWNMTPQEAAAEIVALQLDPKRRIP